ncbi:hypothetical protein KJ611_03610 [Patescibacteria group bacterium]|nr:hypothetical protein [Patescibacteria group bacterium]MBU1705248.1 hypothetical protein [Patescibacteria group bacterium]
MKITVSTVHGFIQRTSQRGPIDTGEIVKAFGVSNFKQHQKLDGIVSHLAGQNMIVRIGTSVQTRNVIKQTKDTDARCTV